MNKPLLSFSKEEADTWTVDDAMKGISIIGGTGSGKTSASGEAIALKYLEEGWGGIVLCAKNDEAGLWDDYCKETNRSDDLIIFGNNTKHGGSSPHNKGQTMVFNPIDYELKRIGEGAGDTQNLTNIFMNVYRMGNRIAGEGENHEERFWDSALKRCLNRAIELLKLAGEDLKYNNLTKILSTAHNVNEKLVLDTILSLKEEKEADKLKQQDYFCLKCLVKAYFNIFKTDNPPSEQTNAFQLANDYFVHAFNNMGSRTKAIITESFMGIAEPFLSGLLNKHFAGTTNIFPEWTYEHNKIIVLNFPIKEFLDAGIIAQSVFKLMFQQAIERRKVKEDSTPVFLWCDEAQYFLNPQDQLFLTTARSSRTSTVFLSQSISNYLAVMSGKESKARVDSLMGNLSTKIFHANSDAVTNEYASRLIGQDKENKITAASQNDPLFNIMNSKTETIALDYVPQVKPKEFTTLLSGGANNDYKVQAIITVSGRKWANNKNFIRVSFKQAFKS